MEEQEVHDWHLEDGRPHPGNIQHPQDLEKKGGDKILSDHLYDLFLLCP